MEEDSADELGWEQFVIDLATLEWTYSEVFDGPGVENDPPYGAAHDFARGMAVIVFDVRSVLVLAGVVLPGPSVLTNCATRRAKTSPPAPAATFLAITGRDYVVRHVDLSQAEHALLSLLLAGETVSEAIATSSEDASSQDLKLNSPPGSASGRPRVSSARPAVHAPTPASLLERIRSADADAWKRFVRIEHASPCHLAGQRGLQAADTADLVHARATSESAAAVLLRSQP